VLVLEQKNENNEWPRQTRTRCLLFCSYLYM